jgi:hypothetical protein
MKKDKLSAWVQTYSGCNPCHMANAAGGIILEVLKFLHGDRKPRTLETRKTDQLETRLTFKYRI